MTALEFTAPIRIESANRTRDRHWAIRKRATDKQRTALYWAYRDAIGPTGRFFADKPFEDVRPLTITLTRIAPRPITDEHDNLRSGFKAAVDMIAELVGADDGDKSITWVYQQEKGKPREYAVRVHILSHGITEKES